MATQKNTPKSKPIVGAIIFLVVIVLLGYYALSNNTPKKPVWNENDRKVTQTGTTTSDTSTGDTTPPATDSGSMTPPPPDAIVNTPAGRDARDSDPLVNPPPVVATNTGTITSTGTTSSGVTEYWNESLGYGFSVPKGTYYLGTGPRDEAAHSVALRVGTGATDFESAEVRVWYYPRKLLQQLAEGENGFYQDANTSRTYMKFGSGTLVIGGTFDSSVVKTIIQTAKVR